MSEGKRYYWIKLYDSFFDDPQIRMLRKSPQGGELVIIYMEMLLLTMKKSGLFKGGAR